MVLGTNGRLYVQRRDGMLELSPEFVHVMSAVGEGEPLEAIEELFEDPAQAKELVGQLLEEGLLVREPESEPSEPDERPQVHIINPFMDGAGGSEHRAIELYRALEPHCNAQLWSQTPPSPSFEDYPIQLISGPAHPVGGTLVFIGVYFPVSNWIHDADPARTILLYNTPDARLDERIQQVGCGGSRDVELVFASTAMRAISGRPGEIQTSLIDLATFRPGATRDPDRRFVVGRMSRDVSKKHAPEDLHVYRKAIDNGCRVEIMGGTVLELFARVRRALGDDAIPAIDDPNFVCTPAMTTPPGDFLRRLDCFYYRTSPSSFEASARVVHEAMACGLPVVCHEDGGYRDVIDHGRNGFLFGSSEEAIEMLLRLADDQQLRADLGRAARADMEALHGVDGAQNVVDFYVSGPSAGA